MTTFCQSSLVIPAFGIDNGWDFETGSNFDNILLMTVLLLPNLPYFQIFYKMPQSGKFMSIELFLAHFLCSILMIFPPVSPILSESTYEVFRTHVYTSECQEGSDAAFVVIHQNYLTSVSDYFSPANCVQFFWLVLSYSRITLIY